eukprot:jgi/Botrbrau1/6000/Bobra.104_1s0029.2
MFRALLYDGFTLPGWRVSFEHRRTCGLVNEAGRMASLYFLNYKCFPSCRASSRNSLWTNVPPRTLSTCSNPRLLQANKRGATNEEVGGETDRERPLRRPPTKGSKAPSWLQKVPQHQPERPTPQSPDDAQTEAAPGNEAEIDGDAGNAYDVRAPKPSLLKIQAPPFPHWDEIQGDFVMTPQHEMTAATTPGYWQIAAKGLELRGGRSLSKYMNACIVFSTKPGTILSMARDVDAFDRINLATAFHRLAKMSKRDQEAENIAKDPSFKSLLDRCRYLLQTKILDGRQTANIYWALGTLRTDGDGLMDDLAAYVPTVDPATFTEQEMSNILWAAATLKQDTEAVERMFNFIADECLHRRLSTFTPQACSNMMWSFATLNYRNEKFFKAACEAQVKQITDNIPQGISNSLWACCILNFYDEKLCAAGADEMLKRGEVFSGQEMCNSLFAFAKLGFLDRAIMDMMSKESLKPARLREMLPIALVNICWSFAKLRWDPGRLVDVFEDILVAQNPPPAPREMANFLWATAKLNRKCKRMFQYAFKRLQEAPEEWTSQEVANLLWTMSVLKMGAEPAFEQLVKLMVSRVRHSMAEGSGWERWSGNEKGGNQLFQAVIMAKVDAGLDFTPLLGEELYQKLERRWREVATVNMMSAFHLDVAKVLTMMGVPHEMEKLTEDGYASLDILVQSPKGPVAVEVDGPYHFTSNTLKPLGSTVLRERMLLEYGYQLVSIPYYEYYLLENYYTKSVYLAKRLQSVGLDVSPLSRSDYTMMKGGALGSPTILRGRIPDHATTDDDEDFVPIPSPVASSTPAYKVLSRTTRSARRVLKGDMGKFWPRRVLSAPLPAESLRERDLGGNQVPRDPADPRRRGSRLVPEKTKPGTQRDLARYMLNPRRRYMLNPLAGPQLALPQEGLAGPSASAPDSRSEAQRDARPATSRQGMEQQGWQQVEPEAGFSTRPPGAARQRPPQQAQSLPPGLTQFLERAASPRSPVPTRDRQLYRAAPWEAPQGLPGQDSGVAQPPAPHIRKLYKDSAEPVNRSAPAGAQSPVRSRRRPDSLDHVGQGDVGSASTNRSGGAAEAGGQGDRGTGVLGSGPDGQSAGRGKGLIETSRGGRRAKVEGVGMKGKEVADVLSKRGREGVSMAEKNEGVVKGRDGMTVEGKERRRAQLEGMTVRDQLREMCREYGLRQAGRKDDLIDRILIHEEQLRGPEPGQVLR